MADAVLTRDPRALVRRPDDLVILLLSDTAVLEQEDTRSRATVEDLVAKNKKILEGTTQLC